MAGQFLQNDEIVQEDNNVIIEHEMPTNEVTPLITNTKTSHNMHMIMQQSPKDSIETSFLPKSGENVLYHEQTNDIEQVEICNCAKLSRCNSFMLHKLPIPYFIKNILMVESVYQENDTSSNKKVRFEN